MMTSFYNLLKYAATGIASPDMTYFDKMRASTLMGGATMQTLTGQPPLSFKSDGAPLISWSMKGNGSQQGTPTPDAPIMPTFCGVRTRNLCPMIFSHSGIGDDVGAIITMSTRLWSSKIAVLPSQSYYAMINGEASNHEELLFNRIIQYDANGEFISRISVVNQKEAEITTAENCHFVVIDVRTRTLTVDITTDDITAVMLSAGSQASYEPYGYKIPITCAGQDVSVYLGQTQTVRRIKKLVLTGEETVNVYGSAPICFTVYRSDMAQNMRTNGFCTHFPAQYSPASSTVNAITFGAYDKNIFFSFSSETAAAINIVASDTASFKAWLATQYAEGHPVTVWYVLATEQTGIVNEPLAKIGTYADELHSTDAGVSIPTAKGQNTLTVDTPIQPSEMTITYKG